MSFVRLWIPLSRAAAYFGIVFGVGFLLGMIRVPFLVPRIGERWAELSEMPLMFVAIFMAVGFVVRRPGLFVTPRCWLVVGLLALMFLLVAELLLAVLLAGRDVGEYVAGRDPVSGTVYLLMLAVFTIMPWARRSREN